MGTIVYELKEHLHHPKYAWPLSPVRYPFSLEPGEAVPGSFVLRDEEGRAVPMQVVGAIVRDGYVVGGELVWLADLPSGGLRRYELHCGLRPVAAESGEQAVETSEEGETLVAGNGLMRVRVPGDDGRRAETTDGVPAAAFVLELPDGSVLAQAHLAAEEGGLRLAASECLAAGPVMHEQRIRYEWADGGTYTLFLRLWAGMPYVELEEHMDGIAATAGRSLDIRWEGLDPARRYTYYRGEEAIDAYLDERGELPYRLLPYDNARSWHRCRAAAFTDAGRQLEAGLFHGDALQWNDGEYALWRSSDTLAVRFYYDGGGGSAAGRAERLRWSYPLASGTRATKIALYDANRHRAAAASGAFQQPGADEAMAPIDELLLWHSFLPLNKVKDWVLDWEEPQAQYPLLFPKESVPAHAHWWYFDRSVPPQPSDMEEIVDKLSFSFNRVESTSPVTSREFASWVPIFDLLAGAMTPEQFRRFKAASAFMAYVREDEHTAPIRTMLAGHPNFLADFKAVPGYMAALFPHHPHAERWRAHFERAMALNLKYHTRPDVTAWEAEGGRWTENLGCYVWAALVPMLRAAWCLRRTYGDNPLLYPNLAKVARWLLGTLSAPLAGRRSYPPQGAHSGSAHDPFHPPYALRVLGEMLLNYEPPLAERLLAVCSADAPGFESEVAGDIWRVMLVGPAVGNAGTPPRLASAKYTGYGFVLRAAVGTPGEMSVHLQQIDEGPNYRWGRSGDGGNGVLYYYADGKRYSYNRPEDVGDDNMGAGEGSSSFTVLNGHEYASIGRHELTEPLHDFGFAQFASLAAAPSARPLYRSRSVLMSGNDYILVYDEVADMRVRGRFSWFAHRDEDMPGIYQLKPGAPAADVMLGGPVDAAQVPPGGYMRPKVKHGYPDGSKGKYYDGLGHFLTVVTHRGTWQPQITGVQAAGYGAVVSLCGRTDYLFRDASRIRHQGGGVSFDGYAGIVRSYGAGHAEAALFRGRSIGAAGVVASIAAADGRHGAEDAAFAFVRKAGRLSGQASSRAPLTVELELPDECASAGWGLYVDGERWSVERRFDEGCRSAISFELPAGRTSWQWTNGLPVPGEARHIRVSIAAPDAADLAWEAVPAADRYELAVSGDGCASWQTVAAKIRETAWRLEVLRAGEKRHVRVRAWNGPEAGPWSEPAPVYATDRPPAVPEGLRLRRTESGVAVSWGGTTGARTYRLYRRRLDEQEPVLFYEGEARNCEDWLEEAGACGAPGYAYRVSAVNGNGESERSPERDARAGGLIDWDPRPNETFRRYTRSHEYGYNGFHFWDNESKGSLLPYPE